MPYVKRRAAAFLIVTALAIFVLTAALILLMTRQAWSHQQIPCWKARAFIVQVGGIAEAERLAQRRGYTKAQIAEIRRRCGI